MHIIVCYVVSYKHAVALYTHPVIFDRYFLIEHTENTYGISAIEVHVPETLSSDNMFSSSYSISPSNTVYIIFAVFILGSYPSIPELFFML